MNKCFDRDFKALETFFETAYMCFSVEHSGEVVGFVAISDEPVYITSAIPAAEMVRSIEALHNLFTTNADSYENDFWISLFYLREGFSQREVLSQVFDVVQRSNPIVNGFQQMTPTPKNDEQLQTCFGDALGELLQQVPMADDFNMQLTQLDLTVSDQLALFYNAKTSFYPLIEIRRAQQEDHDDLSVIFEANSNEIKETQGEFFLAELIKKCQDENNKALVSQQRDKVLGFIAISNEIDLSVLQKCFELEQFDFLLKPKFVELMKSRKVEIEEYNAIKKEEEKVSFEHEIENKKVDSHSIANTNHFQTYLLALQSKFKSDIQEYENIQQQNEAKNKDDKTNKKKDDFKVKQFKSCSKSVYKIINELTKDFVHQRPSEFFRQYPEQAEDVYGTLSKPDNYLLKILTNYGLDKDQMEKPDSHFVEKLRELQKDARLKAKKEQSMNQDRSGNQAPLVIDVQKPAQFDPAPLQTKFNTFINLTPLKRQKVRETILEQKSKIKNEVFTKEDEEKNIVRPRVLNVQTLYEQLLKKNISLVLVDSQTSNSHESNLALVGLIKTFTDFKLKTHKFTIHPASKFWINSIYSYYEKTNQIPSQKSKFKKEVHTKSRQIQLSEEWVIATMVDIPEEDDLKEPEEPATIDASDLQGGSGLFMCSEDKKAHPLTIEAEIIEFDDLISIAQQLEYFDTMLQKLGVIKEEVKTFDEILEDRKRQAAEKEGEEMGQDENEQKEEQGQIEPNEEENAEEGQAQETQIVEETAEARQVKVWGEQFKGVGDVDKDLRDIPDDASNAFCITLFFTHEDIDNLSYSFIEKAFEQFPDKEYMVITQPHKNKDNQLLRHFTLVEKKPSNTFSHCLQVIHRDYVFYNFIKVKEVQLNYNDHLWERIKSELGHLIPEHFQEEIENVCTQPKKVTRKQRCLVPVLDEEIPLGVILLTDAVNQGYYRSHFNIDAKVSNMASHKDSICKLEQLQLNPIYERQRRQILRKVMSHTEKTMICQEVDKNMKELPSYIAEFEFLSKRTFPLFLQQWDHERDEMDKKELLTPNVAGHERDQLDLKVADFNLFILPKNRILENKVRVNKRIIIVGNGDCGISFAENLLDHPHYKFTSVSIVAPGGISGRNRSLFENLKISFTNQTDDEIDNLILENRINVVNDYMVDLDRDNQIITLSTGFKMPFDELILCFGIQDTSLQQIRQHSRANADQNKKGEEPIDEYAILEDWDGLVSIDNPNIQNLVKTESKLIAEVNYKKPRNVLLYGNGLEIFTLIKGIFTRGVAQERIHWLKNNKYQDQFLDAHADKEAVQPDYFSDDGILYNYIVQYCKRLGVQIEEGHALYYKPDFKLLNKKIGAIVFEKKDNKKVDAKEDKKTKKMQELQKKKKEGPLRTIDTKECRLCISCGAKDIENRNFNFIHESGLVQDGRLIVDKNFKTTDPSIWAGGSHCEFSRRYRTLMNSRSLRMESFNSREIGTEICSSFVASLDAEQGEQVDGNSKPPQFSQPKMAGAIVLDGFQFFKVYAVMKESPEEQAKFEEQKMFEPVVNNTLDEEGNGHQLNIVFDKSGLVRSVTYFSKRQIQVESLKKVVGMHSSQLNLMIARQDAELVTDLPEFFNQTWANALWHDNFQAFRTSLDDWLENEADMQKIAEHLKGRLTESKTLQEDDFKTVWKMLAKDTKEKIKDETVAWLKKNKNHLPMYFLSREDFV